MSAAVPGRSTDRAAALRSRLAQAGLVIVLLAVSVFAVWSAAVTSQAADDAVRATRLSALYDTAAEAIAAQESLERKYRLEPGPSVNASFDAAGQSLQDALSAIEAGGGPSDRQEVANVRTAQEGFLQHMKLMFAAVDNGDQAAVLAQDGQGDDIFHAMQDGVGDAARSHDDQAQQQLTTLQNVQAWTRRLTPMVFLVGLLLAMVLSYITRGYRRLLVSERIQALHAAAHDPLTGLPNRMLLADRIGVHLADGPEPSSPGVALLLVDLDRFKEVNDTFGHQFGDLVLMQIGGRLAPELSPRDVLARLGGDEFAVLLVGVADPGIAASTAERLRNALQRPFVVQGVSVDIEASIGVAVSGLHGQDPDALLRCADIAMYEAKTQHLGVLVYDPATDRHTPAKLALLGDLRRALDTDELQLHYQPKVDLDTGDVVGVEALIRWQHPQHGLIMPDEFIPLAERTGLIWPLTRYVVATAVRQAREWMDRGLALGIAVNLSARNLHDEHLPSTIVDLLRQHQLPPAMLQVEVTESAMAVDAAQARMLLCRIAKAGIKVSVDDFGAGYTSIGQLRDLPIDELKIDRSFIKDLGERTNGLIVRTMIELGHELGLTIVAEGVERAEDLLALNAFGCDTAQGFYIGRPMPADVLDTWYAERRRSFVGRVVQGVEQGVVQD